MVSFEIQGNLRNVATESAYGGGSRKKRGSGSGGGSQIPNQDQDMDIYIKEGEERKSIKI